MFHTLNFFLCLTGNSQQQIITVTDPSTGQPMQQIVQTVTDPNTGATSQVVVSANAAAGVGAQIVTTTDPVTGQPVQQIAQTDPKTGKTTMMPMAAQPGINTSIFISQTIPKPFQMQLFRWNSSTDHHRYRPCYRSTRATDYANTD